ncbi:glyoxylate/hydroxypyruvate reductase A [Stappia sp. F7233]|uniref:Glyoxylate/hydroxypyruvate reductase A n=1 Tax=Stappia albiluteola TaxID=2758565 RepID=A0A839AB96_9HYPH|nr:glyoxylate/hydroxypyruvate reductase A [Stappia albiluteola]MBA5776222.1 glyoxylate/hydroxypyruvate reductase A [Stappia albiluteola]
MAILVAVKGWDPAPWVERMRARLPGRDIRAWPEDAGSGGDIDYVLAWKAPAELFSGLGNLKVIFSLGAGVDHLPPVDRHQDIPVVRVVDPDLTDRMTEWVVMQVLLHHRQHLAYAAQQEQKRWRDLPQPAAKDVRVGILGLGVLGQASALALASLGFKVAGWARSRKQITGVECFAGNDQLDAFLRRTDILVNLLPLTNETRHFVDYAFLGKLARDGALGGPVFINAGRGATQVESDLQLALTDGTLKAASLDVFEHEPLESENPFWVMKNVILTPHIAADSDPESLSSYIAEQIMTFEAGGKLANVVDPATGY